MKTPSEYTLFLRTNVFEICKQSNVMGSKKHLCGTEALHLGLVACGVKKNDEVFVPSITFAGTANAIIYSGAIPHFVDSELETLGIDPIKLDKYLKNNDV